MADTKTPTRRSGSADKVWSDEERAAMHEAARERKTASRRNPAEERALGEADVQAKIAGLAEPDRTMATRIHAIIKAVAPDLWARTWYGSPAYYRDGDLICYFQERAKFKARYAVFAFSDKTHLDDGAMWPNSYALLEVTPAVEARITELVRKAVS
jgi:hypothetical protein